MGDVDIFILCVKFVWMHADKFMSCVSVRIHLHVCVPICMHIYVSMYTDIYD